MFDVRLSIPVGSGPPPHSRSRRSAKQVRVAFRETPDDPCVYLVFAKSLFGVIYVRAVRRHHSACEKKEQLGRPEDREGRHIALGAIASRQLKTTCSRLEA